MMDFVFNHERVEKFRDLTDADERIDQIKGQIKQFQRDDEYHQLCIKQIQEKLIDLSSELEDLLRADQVNKVIDQLEAGDYEVVTEYED